jgi:hypothetical protein
LWNVWSLVKQTDLGRFFTQVKMKSFFYLVVWELQASFIPTFLHTRYISPLPLSYAVCYMLKALHMKIFQACENEVVFFTYGFGGCRPRSFPPFSTEGRFRPCPSRTLSVYIERIANGDFLSKWKMM